MPPSIRYLNQSAPFWDFIASMEDNEHPFFGPTTAVPPTGPGGPWAGRRGHHGWNHAHHHHHHHNLPHRGPDTTAAAEAAAADSPATARNEEDNNDVTMDTSNNNNKEGGSVPDPPEDTPREPGQGCGRRRFHHGPGTRRCGGGARGMRGFGAGPHHYFGPGGQPGFGGPWAGFAPGFRALSNLFAPAVGGEASAGQDREDWEPEADVFDTPGAFVVHVSLPGASKEDIGVTWDPERSELQVAGVVHRPGDEEFLKTLALDERRVGAFERKVRLGSLAHPAQVDVDGISAKLENGILIVEVPKMIGEFVEVKKVDIE